MCEFIKYLKLLCSNKPWSTSCVPCVMLHPSQAKTPSVLLPAWEPGASSASGGSSEPTSGLEKPHVLLLPSEEGGAQTHPSVDAGCGMASGGSSAASLVAPVLTPPFHTTTRPPSPTLLQILRLWPETAE